MNKNKKHILHLSKGPENKFIVALFCLLVCGVVAAIARALFLWEPLTQTETALRIVSIATFIALALLSILGSIWALLSPPWLDRLMRQGLRVMLLLFSCLIVLLACLFAFFKW